jgi:MinD-like ATPase involved in chromosome partitioning or flagellar assembly
VSLPVLTAVTDAEWESELVTALDSADHGVTIVRRCVDVADLLAAASAGTARAVVLSADLRRLDREVLSRLQAVGVGVVGLVEPDDVPAEHRLRQLGVHHVLPSNAGVAVVAESLVRAAGQPAGAPPGDLADPLAALPVLGEPPEPEVESPPLSGPGRVVAVWGPTGAPGRTTVAVTVADEAARLGVSTLLIDADVYGGVVAQVLGILDEAPGVAAAARADNQGELDVAALARLARAVNPRFRVLTGLSRADRWPELRPDAVRGVLDRARGLVALTVVDCGFCVEEDEELSFDTAVPRRNGATLAVLEEADTVVAVGAADPVGIQRLVRALSELEERLAGTLPRVVVNKLRAGVVPGDPAAEVAGALRRFAGVQRVDTLPYDRAALDRALAGGLTLGEAVPSSPLRQALGRLAAELAGVPAEGAPRRRA